MSPNFFSIIIAIILVSGCSSSKTLLQPSETDSLVEYTKALRNRTSAGLDTLLVGIGNDLQESPGYVMFRSWWCPRHADIDSTTAVANAYVSYCREKGGEPDGPFCRQPDNPDTVLFFASVQDNNFCTDTETAAVTTIEPTGDSNAPDYISALRRFGYETTYEHDLRKAEKTTMSAQQIMESQNQVLRNAELMRRIGTRICRRDDSSSLPVTYVGFIERIEETKIQIRIANAQIGNQPGLQPTGFEPSIIWDFPKYWSVCE